MLAFLRRCEAESLGHFHQVGQRIGLHFLNHLASMCFHRELADAELWSYLGTNSEHLREKIGRSYGSLSVEAPFFCRRIEVLS